MVTARKPARKTKKNAASKAKKPFDAFAYLIELGKTIPEEELARMPRDGAKHFDDYLEGRRKDPKA